MGLGEKIIEAIERRRKRLREKSPGPIGQFWRNGGNLLLYNMPVSTGSLIIDGGGYKGEWTAGMVQRYGCMAQIYEPVPAYAAHCSAVFRNNSLITVHNAALGRCKGEMQFSMHYDATSAFGSRTSADMFKASVVDIADVFSKRKNERIACMKLNIEGGEYDVLERMIECDIVRLCDSFLIQFHRQPVGYEERYTAIYDTLAASHTVVWSYYMVWQKWVLNASTERCQL